MTSLAVMWAGTSQRVLRSTDAGRHWSDVTPAGISPRSWTAFYALDDSAAWVVDSPFGTRRYVILRTVDGGHTWSAAPGTIAGGSIGGVTFVDRIHGWATNFLGAAAGSEAVGVLRSGDGGESWSLVAQTDDPSGLQPSPNGLSFSCDKGAADFATPMIGFLTQDCAGGPPGIYRTVDGGAHWRLVTLPYIGQPAAQASSQDPIILTATDAVMEGLYFYGVSSSADALLVTHDAGTSWRAEALPGTGAIDFESVTSGWQLDSPIQATTDGGLTWHPLAVPAAPFASSDMGLQDLGKGIAMAWSRRAAYRTDDGARTWRVITPPGLHD